MSEIAGRNILVTGGASGIGRLMALKMARLGGSLILWDIDAGKMSSVLQELRDLRGGGLARGFLCDVSDRSRVYETADTVRAEVGDVHVLVNNAGIVTGRSLLDIPDERIEATFAVNTLALFWTTKAFLPRMMERNSGHIVTIASAAGLIGAPRLADYSASKWAAVGFDESLRAELRRMAPGVKTTVVCPYYVDTGLFAGARTRFPFLLPILKEDWVAERIVSAIRRDRRRLWMPRMVYTVPFLRIFPVWLFDAVASFLGINASMEEFVGREGRH
ncbi:MAG: SDR family oxidoreductase [Acidobacteriota bacterium]